MADLVLWAALTRHEAQSTQETEDEGTCKQSVTQCRALFCKAGVWHSVKEAYKHMHPHGQQYKLKREKIRKVEANFRNKKRVKLCSSG